MELYIKPVSEIYTQSTEVKRMVVIMSVLAFALLFVAAMNYILNSVSSLPIRARSVGVHKCNGASSKDIFNMFLFETAALFVVALCMCGIAFIRFPGICSGYGGCSYFGHFIECADYMASCDHDLGYIHFVRLATGPFVQRYPGYPSIPGIYFG